MPPENKNSLIYSKYVYVSIYASIAVKSFDKCLNVQANIPDQSSTGLIQPVYKKEDEN